MTWAEIVQCPKCKKEFEGTEDMTIYICPHCNPKRCGIKPLDLALQKIDQILQSMRGDGTPNKKD